jgi:hypothetical protein
MNTTTPKTELPESVVTELPELEVCVQHGNSWLAIHTAAGRVVVTVPIQIASAVKRAAESVRAANARADGLEADARRYRWLRDNLPEGTLNDFDVSDAMSWDAAIDAAQAVRSEASEGEGS